MTLQQAIETLITAKRNANLTTAYCRSLSDYLRQFARGRECVDLASLTVNELEAWFNGRRESLSARASNVGRLSSLFSFAQRRGWIAENPCGKLERVKIHRQPPKILTVEQTRQLLEIARRIRPQNLVYLVVGVFCGIRADEILRLDWSQIDLEEKLVRVDRTKTSRRRLVQIPENASAWLRLHPAVTGPVIGSLITRRRFMRALRNVSAIDLPQNILRHTAVSYTLARWQDIGRTALQMGNSERIIREHYMELVTHKQARAFFKLYP